MPARAATAALMLALALALAGCGEKRGDVARTTVAPVGRGSATLSFTPDARVPVSLTEYRLPRGVRVPRPGTIAFEVTDDGQRAHALAIVGPAGQARTQVLRPGERTVLEIHLPAGTYKWYCPVRDHERRGMVGRVRVGE